MLLSMVMTVSLVVKAVMMTEHARYGVTRTTEVVVVVGMDISVMVLEKL